MPITDLLEENARKFGSDVALVEVNPQVQETRRVLWKDYDLIQPTSSFWYRREITWHVFDEKANRFAQLLMSRGVKKGDQGGNSADELPGMAADLLWCAENRCTGSTDEFPL